MGYTNVTCDSGSMCTSDICQPSRGCVYTNITCNDGSFLTVDSCDPLTGCVYTPIVCDDGNNCTLDTVTPNGCSYTPIACNPPSLARWDRASLLKAVSILKRVALCPIRSVKRAFACQATDSALWCLALAMMATLALATAATLFSAVCMSRSHVPTLARASITDVRVCSTMLPTRLSLNVWWRVK